LDGAPLKLGNYRGKIVLLVFWASWCGPCMAAVPHERELANLFKDRPFVVIGVNGDESRQSALKAVAREQIPWRSFWNGDKGSGGPIATAWNVRGWPTTYLIDATGVIRHKDLYDKALDESVEKLVKQFEAAREVK
jgi:thiol-disulfide isomerase/thioredoxin